MIICLITTYSCWTLAKNHFSFQIHAVYIAVSTNTWTFQFVSRVHVAFMSFVSLEHITLVKWTMCKHLKSQNGTLFSMDPRTLRGCHVLSCSDFDIPTVIYINSQILLTFNQMFKSFLERPPLADGTRGANEESSIFLTTWEYTSILLLHLVFLRHLSMELFPLEGGWWLNTLTSMKLYAGFLSPQEEKH